jgi:DNA-binding transcriptional LysR family regulator
MAGLGCCLASGAVVPLALEGLDTNVWMAMSATYRTDSPPGPAGRWLIDRLKETIDEPMPDSPASVG